MRRITDPRIGIRTEGNTVWPEQFADGTFWNRGGNPHPAQFWFGPDKRHFVLMPMNMNRLSVSLFDALTALVTPEEEPKKIDTTSIPKRNRRNKQVSIDIEDSLEENE